MFGRSVVVRVHLLNTNDNPPAFSEDAYDFQIVENMAGGSAVGTVVATDRDGDVVRYSLQESVAGAVHTTYNATVRTTDLHSFVP